MMQSAPAIIDLFCGVGGFSLGAARAGFDLVGSVDWDKDAMRMHQINFPGKAHWQTDIMKVSGDCLKRRFEFESLDGVIGGPPCQGFSRMGHQRVDDARNDLFVKFFTIVNELKPKFFLAENVLGILDDRNKPLVKRAMDIVNVDYEVLDPLILRASDYGVPTTRTRVFFFGYIKGTGREITKDDILSRLATDERVDVAHALYGLPLRIHEKTSISNPEGWRRLLENPLGNSFYVQRLHGFVPNGVGDIASIKRLKERGELSGNQGTVHNAEVKKRWAKLAQGKQDQVSKARRLEENGFCHTIRAGTGRDKGSFQSLRPIHPTLNRVITPREAARLQSFPDWFQFDKTKWQSFRQIGNSVCPVLAEKLLGAIRSLMEV